MMTPEERARDFFTRAPGFRNSVYLAADFRKAIAAEREACARVVEQMGKDEGYDYSRFAAALRTIARERDDRDADAKSYAGIVGTQQAELTALTEQNRKLTSALEKINRLASPSPIRTFDVAISDLMLITDIARAALKGEGQ